MLMRDAEVHVHVRKKEASNDIQTARQSNRFEPTTLLTLDRALFWAQPAELCRYISYSISHLIVHLIKRLTTCINSV